MFTGIVQNLGRVKKRSAERAQVHFVFEYSKAGLVKKLPLRTGASIAVNGVCLTATKVSAKGFEADAIKQTLEATNLGKLKAGDGVNLERSLRYGDELGGHFVTGHVDDCIKITAIKKQGSNRTFCFAMPENLAGFIAKKGSVTIDGISLTLQTVRKQTFEIGIIPHTLKVTNLGRKKPGDFVNLEIDLVARYLKRLDEYLPAKPRKSTKRAIKTLRTQGF